MTVRGHSTPVHKEISSNEKTDKSQAAEVGFQATFSRGTIAKVPLPLCDHHTGRHENSNCKLLITNDLYCDWEHADRSYSPFQQQLKIFRFPNTRTSFGLAPLPCL